MDKTTWLHSSFGAFVFKAYEAARQLVLNFTDFLGKLI
jgi:hypothetical protein